MQREEFLLAWKLLCHLGNSVNQEKLFLFLWNVNYTYSYFKAFVLLQGTGGSWFSAVQGPGGFCKSIPQGFASRLLQIPAEAQTGFAQCVNGKWDRLPPTPGKGFGALSFMGQHWGGAVGSG